jgi:D-sedoheptulose 7-phosphate isomerase
MKFFDYVKDNYNFEINEGQLSLAIAQLQNCIKNNTTIFACGNGGSGYSAAHFVQDLNKACGAKAFCLNDNWGIVSAIANDINYESVFSEQLKNIRDKYLLIAISCSGYSQNVIKAAKLAKSKGNQVISFTSRDGGKLATREFSDVNINVSIENIFIAESVDSMIFHFLIDILSNKNGVSL